jgi:hypothetical protein
MRASAYLVLINREVAKQSPRTTEQTQFLPIPVAQFTNVSPSKEVCVHGCQGQPGFGINWNASMALCAWVGVVATIEAAGRGAHQTGKNFAKSAGLPQSTNPRNCQSVLARPVMCETKACGGGKAHCCELDRSQCYQKPSWSDYNLGGLRVCNVSAAPRASADSTCETVRTLRNLLVA